VENKLDLILQKLELLESGQTELRQIVHAIHHRQEETDAKLDSLSLDVHKIHGDMIVVKEKVGAIKDEIEFTYQKTSKNEMEIFKLKREQSQS
jgi:chromosome segregation ATPase